MYVFPGIRTRENSEFYVVDFMTLNKLETGLPRNPSCHLMNPGTAEKELTKQQHIKLHFNQLLLIDISNKITD